MTGSHEICTEQSELNEEHFSVRLLIFPGLFEQLGSIKQYHKLFSAKSKTDICSVIIYYRMHF